MGKLRHRSQPGPRETGARLSTTVLVVDDEESFHDIMAKYLGDYRLLSAYNGFQALDILAHHHVDVVLLDLNMPDMTGFEVLDQIKLDRDDVEVIIVTSHTEIANAVRAVKAGAFDFLGKGFENYQQVAHYIERALDHRRWRLDQLDARTQNRWLAEAFAGMEGTLSQPMRSAVTLARQVAPTPLTVLLEGESGVGKEVFAQFLHTHSDRAGRPFRAVNLAGVPHTLLESHLFGHVKGAFTGADRTHVGKFESANKGTVFLDEIGELSYEAQTRLLRVLQEREIERLGAGEPTPVDVRVIAATNKDLIPEVEARRFREDLWFRLNVVRIRIPPLRERLEDLPALVQLLTERHAARMQRAAPTWSDEAIAALRAYAWPGNVRELENLIMRQVALRPGKPIDADDIPPEYRVASLPDRAIAAAAQAGDGRIPYYEAREQFERYFVRLTIDRCGGDKRRAAAMLGVSYSTIKDKCRTSDDDDDDLS